MQSTIDSSSDNDAPKSTTEKITVLKKLLIDDEHPNPTTDPNEKKFFLPKFLTATDWMKDNLSETLAKIVGVRLERSSD